MTSSETNAELLGTKLLASSSSSKYNREGIAFALQCTQANEVADRESPTAQASACSAESHISLTYVPGNWCRNETWVRCCTGA